MKNEDVKMGRTGDPSSKPKSLRWINNPFASDTSGGGGVQSSHEHREGGLPVDRGHNHDIRLLHLDGPDCTPNMSSLIWMFFTVSEEENTIEAHNACQEFRAEEKPGRFIRSDHSHGGKHLIINYLHVKTFDECSL